VTRPGRPRRFVATSSIVALLTLGLPAHGQVAERPGIVALLQAKLYGYATPVIAVTPGEEVTFTNIDIEMHDVVQDVEADGVGAKKPMPWCKKGKMKKHGGHAHGHSCPIFWTPLISLGKTTPIYGLENVKSGETYTFLCTLHHGMKGTLVVI
jgi:plastocyanin